MTEPFARGQGRFTESSLGWIWSESPDRSSGSHHDELRPAVFLDRDGVINAMWYDQEHGLVDSPGNADQFNLLPKAAEGVRCLNEMGLLTVVVSNQPGIAKGRFTLKLLDEMTAKMSLQLMESRAKVDEVLYCLHHPGATDTKYLAQCDCRKPKPGLLLSASRRLGIDLTKSYMVGDGLTDVQAGNTAGCHTIWIGRPKSETYEAMERNNSVPDEIADNLFEAVNLIKARCRRHGNFS